MNSVDKLMQQLPADSHIAAFLAHTATDPRTRLVHITLFLALWDVWQRGGCATPVAAIRQDLMHLAKINSRYTYNKTINELHEYGYIKYLPSSNPRVKSRVWLSV